MKLPPRDTARYCAKPDPSKMAVLIYGNDAMRVALRRQALLAALLGDGAEEEMRLTRLPAAELRKDPAALLDAVKAQGFFPGLRAVHVEGATESLAKSILPAFDDWAAGDAQVVITADQLAAKSSLRKFFETHSNALAIAVYDDPMDRDEIASELSRAGLTQLAPGAMEDLTALARTLDPGDFRQTLEKLALYKMGDDTPVTAEDILECAPRSTEADMDDILNLVADGRADQIAPVMARLRAQGTNAVGLCIGAMRHFKTLYTAASDPGGPAQGIGNLRPPVFGPRRNIMQRQAQNWGAAKLENAIAVLFETDLQLRSAGRSAPDMALVERALVRIAMLARR